MMLSAVVLVLMSLNGSNAPALGDDLAPAVRLEAAGKPIDTEAGHAAPFVCDWDGDGDLDPLVGGNSGSVSLFRNIGSRKSPKLAAPVQLVGPGELKYGPQAPREVRRGIRAKICVVDWNGDGRPDLLVGDLAVQKADRAEPTPEEKAEHARIRKELEPLMNRFNDATQRLVGPSRVRDTQERNKLLEERRQLVRQMEALESKLPPEDETHGWVWLFLRR
jgi:hypothetical protein